MRSLVPLPALAAALALFASCRPAGTALPPEDTVSVPAAGEVVVYVEAPRYLAGPVLKMFSEQTGITVKATYREESPEGFLDRVRADAAAGKADLLWSATPLSAVAMAREGLALPFRPAGARPIPGQYHDRGYRWIGFAVDPRVIIFNHDLVNRDQAPQSVDDLTVGPWAGKAAVARAASGPAAFQAAALFARWGDARGREFYEGTRSVGNRVVESDED